MNTIAKDKKTETRFTPSPWKHDTKFHLYEKDNYQNITAGIGFHNPNIDEKGFTISGVFSDADAKLIVASPLMYDVITKCQNVLAEWIVPDSGISDSEALSKLLEILDNESLVKTLKEINK